MNEIKEGDWVECINLKDRDAVDCGCEVGELYKVQGESGQILLLNHPNNKMALYKTCFRKVHPFQYNVRKLLEES